VTLFHECVDLTLHQTIVDKPVTAPDLPDDDSDIPKNLGVLAVG
jgi:hypothetical protein